MADNFQQSSAREFTQSPARERGVFPPCQKVGWDVATIAISSTPSTNPSLLTPVPKPVFGAGFNHYDGFAWWGSDPYPALKACALPRGTGFRLDARVQINSLPNPPQGLGPAMMFRMIARRGATPELYAPANLGGGSRIFRNGSPYFVETSSSSLSGLDYRFGEYPPDHSFQIPWVVGLHEQSWLLNGFDHCYTFFNLNFLAASFAAQSFPFPPWYSSSDTAAGYPINGFGGEDPGGSFEGTFTLYRLQRMIVRYITSHTTRPAGQPIQFTDISITDNRKLSWLWEFGDGTTSAVQNPSKSYASPGSYIVRLSITDSSLVTYTTTASEQKTILIT